MFSDYLEPLLHIGDTPPNSSSSQTEYKNFQKMLSSTVMFSAQKLHKLADKIDFVRDIMPANEEDTVHPRHKRMLFSVLSTLLVKAIAKDVEDRNATAQAEIRDLELAIEALTNPPVTESPALWEFEDLDPTSGKMASITYRGKRQIHFMAISPLMKLGHISQNLDAQNEKQLKDLRARLHELLHPVVADIPDLWAQQHGKVTLERNKRQILALAALTTGAVGTFLGLFNSAELAAITTHLDSIAGKQDMLVHISEHHEQQIAALAKELLTLTDLLETLIKYNPTLMFARLDFHLGTLEDRVDALVDTVQQLQHHKLSIKLLTHKQLIAMHNDVMSSAEKLSTIPIPQNLQDYFQLEASYLTSGNEILILLHVPCSATDNLLTIYKYIPFPFPVYPTLSDLNVSSHISTIQDLINLEHSLTNPAELEGITFKSDSDLIAIGKKIGERDQYMLLTSADLAACYQRSHTYICERHQVLRADLEGSCLGALFTQNPAGVGENCQIDRKPLRETVYQLTDTDHLVFSPQPLTTEILCQNGTHFPLKVKATVRISIPEGCSTQLINHTIQSDFSLRLAPEALHFEWEFDPSTLPESAHLIQGTRHIDRQLALVRQHLGSITANTTSHQVFEDMLVRNLSSPNKVSILIWVCLSLLGLTLLAVTTICLHRRLTRPKPHRTRQMEHGFHLVTPSAPPASLY